MHTTQPTYRIWLAALVLTLIGLALTAAPAWACGGGTRCVDTDAPGPAHDGTTWETAFLTVQDALAEATSGNEIWVAEGIYYPDEGAGQTNNDVNSTFTLKAGVALYGGFAATETQRTERDWASHVTVLSGDIDQNDTVNAQGVVTDTANIAGSNALHVVSSGGVTESARLDGFNITAGKANGNGGGIFNTAGNNPTLINLIVRGNTAQTAGGGMHNNATPSLTNVVFANNTADYGGGMNNNAAPVFTNVTFYGNHASIEGGGLRNWASSPTLVNCILWGNSAPTGPQIYNPDGGDPTITYSDVQGGYAGEGNINADPLFVDAANGNWHLDYIVSSPAIDAGNSRALPTGLMTDLDGHPRVVGMAVDMGAYESTAGIVAKIHDPAHTPLDSAPISATFQIHAQITVLAGPSGLTPTGVVTFSRYADGDCSGAALTTDTLTLRDGLTETVPFSISEFFYRATYSGDAYHPPQTSACRWFNVYSFVYVDADATGAATGLNWTDAYTTVQDALAVAEYEDEIWVAEGVYYPDEGAGQTNNAIMSTFVLTDGVSLYGGFAATETLRTERDWAAHVTVLSGDIDQNDGVDAYGVVTDTANINGSNALHVITSSIGVGDTTILDGFNITAGDGGDGNGGGMTNGGSPSLRRLVFSGNRAGWGGGLYNSGSPSISQVTFMNNYASGKGYSFRGGGGMQNDGDAPTLTDVAFIGNESPLGGGGLCNYAVIWLVNASFSNNTGKWGGGIYNQGMAILNDLTFSNNTADYDGGGIFFESGPLLLDHGTFQGNHAQSGGGMYTSNWGSRSVTLHDVSFISNTAVRGGGLRSTSWDPLTLDNVFFIGNSATEGGGFHTRTSLYDDNHKLNGVQFIGNHAQRGGGVYVERGIHTFTDVIFENNDADYGGGLYNARHPDSETSIGRPHLINTIFISNSAVYDGGGLYNTFGEPALENVTFTANHAENGGGMYNTCGGLYTNPDAGVASLSNTHFISNSAVYGGGGLYNTDGTLLLAGARLITNRAENGGGLYNTDGSTATLTNTLFFSNSATALGGGLYNQDSIAALANGTLAANAATIGGAVTNSGGDAGLVNGILWGNTAAGSYSQIYNVGGSVAVTYSDVQGGYAGTGNLDADPRFVDAAAGDLRLGAGSPAVDAGNNLAVTLPTDIAGNPRIVNGAVDMGAYEALSGILTLHKAVTPTADIAYHSAVSYTLTLTNVGAFSDTVILTDTLPDGVVFGGWVVSPAGTLRAGQAITWTGIISAGKSISLTFTATHNGDYGDTITNTAYASSTRERLNAATAFTVQQQYTLTARATGAGGGSVASDPPGIACGADCTEPYADGTRVILTATPLLSSTFSGWNGAVTTTTNPISLTVSADRAVTATFDLLTHTLDVATAGDGRGTVALDPPGGVYDYGTVVTLTATPEAGSTLAGWSGDAGGGSTTVTTTMTADRAVTATFDLLTYTLTAHTVGSGSVTRHPTDTLRLPGQSSYLYGTAVTLTANAERGAIFDGWRGDLSGLTNPATLTMDADKVVTATFVAAPPTYYTLTMQLVGSGVITPSVGAHSTLSGTVVALHARPAAGWQFDGWRGAVTGTLTQTQVVMDADKSVSATFIDTQPDYTLYLPLLLRAGAGRVR